MEIKDTINSQNSVDKSVAENDSIIEIELIHNAIYC